MRLPEDYKKVTLSGRGFSLVELMVVVAVIAILATLALPSNLHHRQRIDVAEAMRMADTIREDITYYYSKNLSFPEDNEQAGIPEPEMLIGNKVTSIVIEDGAIHITLGNKVSQPLQDKILSLRPAVVTDSPRSPISWLCGIAEPVPGMEAVGENKTDLPDVVVPVSCAK